MTGLNEFKEWVAMERNSIKRTLPSVRFREND